MRNLELGFCTWKTILFGDGRPLEISALWRFASLELLDFGPIGIRLRFQASKSFDKRGLIAKLSKPVGVVAQLVEHHNGIVGVRGSNPLGSTILRSERFPFRAKDGVLTGKQSERAVRSDNGAFLHL